MRYKVEFLRDDADARSICHERYVYVDTLEDAIKKGWEEVAYAQRYKEARAFQVIDLHDGGKVLARRAWLKGGVEPLETQAQQKQSLQK